MYIKAKNWEGQDLQGKWNITSKVDGIRAFLTPEGAFSRANKPLANLEPYLPATGMLDVEVFIESFGVTQGYLMTKEVKTVPAHAIYTLLPIDARLDRGVIHYPTANYIRGVLELVLKQGHEGLVLRQEDTWLKVKPVETHDVPITKLIEGKGKHVGSLGAVMTPMGRVGTGFDDVTRAEIWATPDLYVGMIIEVECLQVTTDGKFRHPRFKRLRLDKT